MGNRRYGNYVPASMERETKKIGSQIDANVADILQKLSFRTGKSQRKLIEEAILLLDKSYGEAQD